MSDSAREIAVLRAQVAELQERGESKRPLQWQVYAQIAVKEFLRRGLNAETSCIQAKRVADLMTEAQG